MATKPRNPTLHNATQYTNDELMADVYARERIRVAAMGARAWENRPANQREGYVEPAGAPIAAAAPDVAAPPVAEYPAAAIPEGWTSGMAGAPGGATGYNYPGPTGIRNRPTGMQQLVSRGMDMLREHAPDIADQAVAALRTAAPRLGAVHDYRTGARSEIAAGIAAGKSAADVKAGLADNIAAFSTAFKPKDAARFNERVTSRAGRRVDRAYARRNPAP